MFGLFSKTKLKAHNITEISPSSFEILGVGQINPYCKSDFESEISFTLVSLCFESKKFDERTALVLSTYFSLRKCPKCAKVELIPAKIRVNFNHIYLRNEEEIAFDAYEENPPQEHFPTFALTYCSNCSRCFEIRLKSNDCWVKQAKKIKKKNIITNSWDEYLL